MMCEVLETVFDTKKFEIWTIETATKECREIIGSRLYRLSKCLQHTVTKGAPGRDGSGQSIEIVARVSYEYAVLGRTKLDHHTNLSII